MPEVTEIRKYADFIKKHMKGKNLLDIKILKGRYKKHKPFEKYALIKKSVPLKIIDVVTKGYKINDKPFRFPKIILGK